MNKELDENKAKKLPVPPKKPDKKEQQKRELENFKRKYFDYYDDIKISVKEDW